MAEIGRFNKSEEECLTTRDRLFYWFRHANEFKEKPAWLDDPETKALLTSTEIAAFTPEKKEQYEQDMKNEQDIEYEKSICYNEGLEEAQKRIALNLKSKGMPFEFILDVTGLPEGGTQENSVLIVHSGFSFGNSSGQGVPRPIPATEALCPDGM